MRTFASSNYDIKKSPNRGSFFMQLVVGRRRLHVQVLDHVNFSRGSDPRGVFLSSHWAS